MAVFSTKLQVYLSREQNQAMHNLWDNKEIINNLNIEKKGQFKRYLLLLGMERFKELHMKEEC
ncbi:hypothetical protein ES703_81816 [subsurface metagenome]